MKKITLILFLCLISFNTSIYSQNKATLDELLDRLSENHMGSVTDVFSTEEIETLKSHFYTQNNEDTESSVLFGNRLFTSTENVEINVVAIDSDDLSMFNNIGPSPLTEFEGAGVVILEDNATVIVDNVGNIFMRPLGTNTYNNIGFANAPPGESFTGLERLSDGTVFGLSTDGVGSTTLSVFDFDVNPIEVTPIGPTGQVLGIALGRDDNDLLYSHDLDTDELVLIDKTTGVSVPVGPIGFDANFGQGMSWDPHTQKLMMTAFNNGLFDSELREVNTDTGLTITLGTITPGSLDQFGFVDAFPENLGIDENQLDGFTFSPNPATAFIDFKANSAINSIEIYNILGQKVLQQSIEAITSRVDIQYLKSGYYILNVTVNGNKGSFKLLKQ
ncbi:MAG: T9SS type A sorting domain-containing protein [Flavobacteriaceae bacterium]|nr:T9SS type A sorting domain-containing protein [Flavobacteriaceae bacterium]